MKEFITCFKKYFNFKERARRREFWFFALFGFIILAILGTLDYFLATTITYKGFIVGGWLMYFGALLMLFPFSAALTRRLHDTGKPEIWMILLYVTVIGLGFGFGHIATAYADTHSTGSLILLLITIFIFAFYLIWLTITLCINSEMRENKYGPCPKISLEEIENIDFLKDTDEEGETIETDTTETSSADTTETANSTENTNNNEDTTEKTDEIKEKITEEVKEDIKEEETPSIRDQILTEIDKLEQNIDKEI